MRLTFILLIIWSPQVHRRPLWASLTIYMGRGGKLVSKVSLTCQSSLGSPFWLSRKLSPRPEEELSELLLKEKVRRGRAISLSPSLLNSSAQTSRSGRGAQRWFLESVQVGAPGAGRIRTRVGHRAPEAAAQSGEKERGRRPRPTSAPAPGQPLPRRDSPAVPTPSPAAPSGRRGPALLSRVPGSDLLRALGIDSLRGVCQQRGREGKGGKVLGAEGEVRTPRPRGWRRTSLQLSAHGERVAGRQRRGGQGTRRRRTGRVLAASEGVQAIPGHS